MKILKEATRRNSDVKIIRIILCIFKIRRKIEYLITPPKSAQYQKYLFLEFKTIKP